MKDTNLPIIPWPSVLERRSKSLACRSQRRSRSLATAVLVCVAWFAISTAPRSTADALQSSPDDVTASDSPTLTDSAPPPPGGSFTSSSEFSDSVDENLTLKLIPNQQAFVGSPDTLIDLSELFSNTSLGDPPWKLEILRSKKDVAEAVIEGDVLRLTWQSKTAKQREVLLRATDSEGQSVDTKFYVELWEPDYWKLVLTVLGGLGLFLLGMKNLSEGLQAIAGNGLRRMISLVTDNRLMATGVGILVTMLVQSSSITTVMVVGFVNSGFMTLTQAVGVIMGANIGTTITGWILVLKIGKYGLPIAGAAAFCYLFAKRDRLRYTALAILGLGLVFLGLEVMKDGFAIIKELPKFEAWFQAFDASSYLGVLKCALVGCVLTFIVQSSSATLGITIGLAQIGVIGFETAAALVLGENIGTTITAWLASIGSNTNAKRAAYFHVMFNLLGVAWITAVFPAYLMLVRYVVAGDASADMTLDVATAATITAGIATAHTGFNVTNTVVFLPLAGYMSTLLCKLIREPVHARRQQAHLTSLDIRMLESAVVAVEQSRKEVLKMGDSCHQMMVGLRQLLESPAHDPELTRNILKLEKQQDDIQNEIVTFLSNLLGGNVPHDVVAEARRQLRMADEYESVSDCIATILKAHRHLHRHEMQMPADQRAELIELHDMVADYLDQVSELYQQWGRAEIAVETLPHGEGITKHVKMLGRRLLAKQPEEQIAPRSMVSYNRAIAAYRRIRDHLVNIIEALAGEK